MSDSSPAMLPRIVPAILRRSRRVLHRVRAALAARLEGAAARDANRHIDDNAARNLFHELAAELSFSTHDQADRIAGLHNLLHELNLKLSNLEQLQAETRNLAQHTNTSIHTRLDQLENVALPAISQEVHATIALQFDLLSAINADKAPPSAHPDERYEPAKKASWDAVLDRARREFPAIFPPWKERLVAVRSAFQHTKVGNAAWAGDVHSRVFRGFVERYAHGRVLDVGCGIFGRPYYLKSYPGALVSGLDPLEPNETTDFEFVRGISEYLPWPDASFSTVISATSLDHCFALDRSMAEIGRVLRPGGSLLLWIGSNPGAPKYQPEDPKFVPADQFHLFHFDIAWFEPMLTNEFELVDRVVLPSTGYSSVMYRLDRRTNRPSPASPETH